MKTIVVAGGESGAGKTTLACRILEALPGWGGLKLTPVGEHACRRGPACPGCHGLIGPLRIAAGTEALSPAGSDTSRYHRAGAARVAWLLAREEYLGSAICEVLALFPGLPGIVIEGGSFARHARPSRLVFVARVGYREIKPQARDLVTVADRVVLNRPIGSDPREVRRDRRRLIEEWGAREVVDLDAASPGDPATAAFLDDVRATWARC